MENKKSELREFVHNLWVRSQYSFDEQTAQRDLNNIIDKIIAKNKISTLSDLLIYVTNYFQENIFNIHSKSRKGEYVRVRQIYCYMARQLFPRASLSIIAGIVRVNYDHATALHGIRTITNELDTDRLLRNDMERLFNKLEMITEDEAT